jgi:hypothetical protein
MRLGQPVAPRSTSPFFVLVEQHRGVNGRKRQHTDSALFALGIGCLAPRGVDENPHVDPRSISCSTARRSWRHARKPKYRVNRKKGRSKRSTYSLLKNLHGVSDPTNFTFRWFFNEHVEFYSVEPIRIVTRSYCGDNLSKPFACPAGQ